MTSRIFTSLGPNGGCGRGVVPDHASRNSLLRVNRSRIYPPGRAQHRHSNLKTAIMMNGPTGAGHGWPPARIRKPLRPSARAIRFSRAIDPSNKSDSDSTRTSTRIETRIEAGRGRRLGPGHSAPADPVWGRKFLHSSSKGTGTIPDSEWPGARGTSPSQFPGPRGPGF